MGGHLLVLEKWAWDCVVYLSLTLHAIILQQHWHVCHAWVPADIFFEEADVWFTVIGPRGSSI